jgi:hypothetical protein
MWAVQIFSFTSFAYGGIHCQTLGDAINRWFHTSPRASYGVIPVLVATVSTEHTRPLTAMLVYDSYAEKPAILVILIARQSHPHLFHEGTHMQLLSWF